MDYSNEKFIVVYPDGKYSIRSPKKDERVLKFLQHNVNGLIDCVELEWFYSKPIGRSASIDMFVNDEGIINEMQLNKTVKDSKLFTDAPIYGPVVLACSDIDGETFGLVEPDGNDAILKRIVKTLNESGATLVD